MKHGDAETETEPVNNSRGTSESAFAASKTDEDEEVVPQAGDQSEVIEYDVQVSEAVLAAAAVVAAVAVTPETANDGELASAFSEPLCFVRKGRNIYTVSCLAVIILREQLFITG